MHKTLALCAALRARHSQHSLSSARPGMLPAVQPGTTASQQGAVHSISSQLAAQHAPLTCYAASLIGAALTANMSQNATCSTASAASKPSWDRAVDNSQRGDAAGQTEGSHTGVHEDLQADVVQLSSFQTHQGQGAARHAMQQMSLAMQRQDYDAAGRLFDLRLVQQAKGQVGGGMCQMMLRVLAARGEGQLALALLKDMRAVGQYLTPSAYSLMVQAFCKAGALQDAVLHIQCSVPPERLDTFMVNGILIAAVQAQQHQLIMQQCLDLLEERGLAWNSTTWRQVLRLQVRLISMSLFALCAPDMFQAHEEEIRLPDHFTAKSGNVESVMQVKGQLDSSPWAHSPDIHTAYIRALCTCNDLAAANQALHHLLHTISPASQQAVHKQQSAQAPSFPPPTQHQQPAAPHAATQQQTALLDGDGASSGGRQQPATGSRPHWRSWVDAELDSSKGESLHAQPTATQNTGSSQQHQQHQQQHSQGAMPSGVSGQVPGHGHTQQQGSTASMQSNSYSQLPRYEQSQRLPGQKLGEQSQEVPSPSSQSQRSPDLNRQSEPGQRGLSRQQLKLIQEACHAVMTLAERQQQQALVLPILESMKEAEIESDTAIQNSVMRVAKQQGQNPAQLEAYLGHLQLLGLQPDEQTFNVLLRAYIADSNLQGAAGVLDRMTDHGVLPGRYTFNAMLEAHAATGDVQGASAVFSEMQQHGVKPDHCSFIALFMAVKNKFQAAHSTAGPEEKHKRMLQRDAVSEQLHEWVADMRAAGLRHTGPSLTALVQAYGHLMEFTHMMLLLRSSFSTSSSVKPNLRTYNAAISALCKVGHLTRALRLQHEMVAAGVAPNVHTFTSLISACGFKRQLQTCNQLWGNMLQAEVQPGLFTFNAKVKTECIVGDFESACDTIAGMMEGQVQPDVTTWQAILAAAHRFQRSDVVKWVAQQAPRHVLEEVSEPHRHTLAGESLLSHLDEAQAPLPHLLPSPEILTADELEAGGWSSGFDDSDDDIIGGSF